MRQELLTARLQSDPPSRTFVVGTAGHVDHGKSTLVKALTGIDPDRLAEEKARHMTIDLGFAHLALPSGRQIGIVDVPGHERFIKNMLAGVGGIDAALLVIAADEGPMPQTREHLAILDLLVVNRGVIVLTKRDTVDADWLDLVTEEVRESVAGTVLADAPIVAVSALDGSGLPALLSTLDQVMNDVEPNATSAVARLPIDRVFSIAGFGTIVTGTLLGGAFAVGQEIRVVPSGLATRIRGLQSHGAKVNTAHPGSRVAVNVTNLAVEDLKRGEVLTLPGSIEPTRRLDVSLRMLPGSPVALKQNDQVDLFVGAAEVAAGVTLLDREELGPGDQSWVQLRLRQPLAVLRGDRFIVRRPSPSVTIGGGIVIDAAPPRHRRFRPEVVGALETLAIGTPDEIVLQELEAKPVEVKALLAAQPAGLKPAQIESALAQLIAEGDAQALGVDVKTPGPTSWVVAMSTWVGIRTRMVNAVTIFHEAQPLRKGMPKELLKSRLAIGGPARLFGELVTTARAAGALVDDGQTVRLPEFVIVLDPDVRAVADRFLVALSDHPYAPPSPTEFGLDGAVVGALIDLGEVTKVAEGVVFTPTALADIERAVVLLIDRDGSVTIAAFRDHVQTSRKYAQAVLEYCDQRRITRRVGDERVRFSVPLTGRTGGDS